MSVGGVGDKISGMISNAPLPLMVEKLGLSIAQAQAALDENSVATAAAMAQTEVQIGSKTYNLLSLGFKPTFYAFTEANIEAKLSFKMSKSRDFSVGAKVKVKYMVVTASVEASYSQKFSMSAEGSSSVSARLVAIPAPEIFQKILESEFEQSLDD